MTVLKSANQPVNGKQRSLADLTPRELEILQLMLAGYTKPGVRTRMLGAEPREIPS